MANMSDLDHDNDESVSDNWFSVEEYLEAVIKLGSAITPLHRRMLVAHADAPECMLSVRQLAAAGGYEKSNVVYSQYGRLGRLIADSLGVKEHWKVYTNFIGQGFRTVAGELIWEMHPELVEALGKLKWSTRPLAKPSFEDIAVIAEEDGPSASETERDALLQARIGQGAFRMALMRYWGSCAVTGISEPAVLRASHIKPWRSSTNQERLDPFNGLLLAAHIDALFDAGLVTFEENGQIRLSLLLAGEDLQQLGIVPTMRLRRVAAEHKAYLRLHHEGFRSGVLRDA